MELRQLKIFCAAAETLNFTKAAAQLGYAQSNITSQIQHLEDELEVKLFERLNRGLQLTIEGKRFLQNAKIILSQCKKAKEELSPNVFKGALHIGLAETLCVYRLPQLLVEYRQRYPLVDIRVQTASCNTLFNLIRNNTVDIAMALTEKIGQPDMIVKTLCVEPMSLVAHPSHPLAQKKAITPQDLSNEYLIITEEGCGYRPTFLSLLRNCNIVPGAIMELSSIGAIKQCTACGLGYSLLPKVAVQEEIHQGKLTELLWQGPDIEVKNQLFYHREKWLSPAIRAFLDLCEHMEINSP